MITTDVDKLIDFISKRKKLELSEIINELNRSFDEVKYWVKVLEAEGYVRVYYTLTKTYVEWIGQDKKSDAKKAVEATKPTEKSKGKLKKIEKKVKLKKKLNKKEKKKPEEKRIIKFGSPKPTKEKMLIKVKKAEESPVKVEDMQTEVPNKPLQKKEEKRKIFTSLREYLEEINKVKSELARLKESKERLYTGEFAELQALTQAKADKIAEKVMEKEQLILSLQDRIASLPDKYEKVAKYAGMIDKIEKRAQDETGTIKKLLNLIKNEVADLIKEVSEQKKDIDSAMKEEEILIDTVEKEYKNLIEKEKELRAKVDSIRSTVSELQMKAEEADRAVTSMAKLRLNLSDRIDMLRESTRRRKENLEEILKQIENTKQLEKEISEYYNNYENLIADIEKDFAETQEVVENIISGKEKSVIHLYEKNLNSLIKEYVEKSDEIVGKERAIEKQVNELQEYLKELLDKAKDLASGKPADLNKEIEKSKIIVFRKEQKLKTMKK